MTAWFPVDGGFTPGGMDNVMSGTWDPQAELRRLQYNNIPPFPQPPRSNQPCLAGTASSTATFTVTAAAHGPSYQNLNTFSPATPQPFGLIPGLSQPSHSYQSLAPPPGALPIAGNFDGNFLGLPGLLSPGSGFSTSSNPAAGREGPGLPAGPAPLQTATASDPSVPRGANPDCTTTTFTSALNNTTNSANLAAARQHHHAFSFSAAFSAPPFSANSTAVAASLSDDPEQTPSRLPQSRAAVNGANGLNFADLATAPAPNFFPPFFTSAPFWPCIYSSGQQSAPLPPPIPPTFPSLHSAHPGLEAQSESLISLEDQYGRSQHEGGHVAEIYHDDTDENGRIPVDSLLEAMPAPSSRKRTRTAASLDEHAGPSTVKRGRSHSSRASVSARPTSSKSRKSTRGTRPVVIPDSDDVFAVDADDEQLLFDLTRDDHIPEELMVVAKEDNDQDKSTKLGAFECIICMDSATNLTVTHCGHMFCGQCLHQAMHAEVTKKICPMCRQKLELRPKTGAVKPTAKTFFHLELKLKPSKKQGKQPVRR